MIANVDSFIHTSRSRSGNNQLLSFDSRLNERDAGWTPPSRAVFQEKEDELCRFLELGADIHTSQHIDHSLLILACLNGNMKIARFLVEGCGADVNQCSGSRIGYSPLMAACEFRHFNVVSYLLDIGADIHHIGENGRTCLFYASVSGCEASVRLLLNRGVDINALDARGQSALLATLRHADHKNVISLLLAQGANINFVDKDGYSPLFATILFRSADTLSLLLSYKPNLQLYAPPCIASLATELSITKSDRHQCNFGAHWIRWAAQRTDDEEILFMLTQHIYSDSNYGVDQDHDNRTDTGANDCMEDRILPFNWVNGYNCTVS